MGRIRFDLGHLPRKIAIGMITAIATSIKKAWSILIVIYRRPLHGYAMSALETLN